MTQIQLTDTQSIILSTACGRDDGMVFPITAKLKGGAVGNVCKSLLKHALLEEVVATDVNTVWRHDEERGSITLRATPLAYSTLGISDDPAPESSAQIMAEQVRRRAGTKQDTLIAILRAPEGATIAEIGVALLWAPHTIRGAMAGALKKKLGLEVTSEKIEPRGRVYRVGNTNV